MNTEVLKKGHGVIIPYRRPAENIPYTRYLPCDYCHGFYKKDCLWQHMKVCPFNCQDGTNRQRRVQSKCAMLLPVCSDVSPRMREDVLEKMQHDDISLTVKNDSLIMNFGCRLYFKVGHSEHMHSYVSQKMRELGRLLSKARELSESVSSLSTLIDPCKFKIVVDAVKAVCGFDDSSHKFITPSLGLKLGHSLKKCAAIVKSRGLQNDDDATVQQADKFIQLCESDWPEAVSSHAL